MSDVSKKEELQFQAKMESFRSTISYGIAAMKSLYLVSGGSAAALLAFMGHLITNDKIDMAKSLSMPLCVFFFASLLASGCLGCSYLSQERYTQNAMKVGAVCQIIAVLFTFGAYVVCIAGMVLAYATFMSF